LLFSNFNLHNLRHNPNSYRTHKSTFLEKYVLNLNQLTLVPNYNERMLELIIYNIKTIFVHKFIDKTIPINKYHPNHSAIL